MVKIQNQTSLLKNLYSSNLEDVRQTKEYAHFMKKIGWQIFFINSTFIFLKKLPLLPFSVLKVLRYKSALNKAKIEALALKNRAKVVKKEPFKVERIENNQIYFKVFSNNKWPLTPTKTLWLDLKLKEKTLLKNLKPKTRYNLKKAVSKNLDVKVIEGGKINFKQLQGFYKLWKNNKPHNFLFKPSFNELKFLTESFGEKCFFVLVSYRNKLAASSLQLETKNMVFYWHNLSTNQGKKLFAPTLCVWKAIIESKKRKKAVFDFEGVWDERYPRLNQGWKGFTRFKKGFVKSL